MIPATTVEQFTGEAVPLPVAIYWGGNTLGRKKQHCLRLTIELTAFDTVIHWEPGGIKSDPSPKAH